MRKRLGSKKKLAIKHCEFLILGYKTGTSAIVNKVTIKKAIHLDSLLVELIRFVIAINEESASEDLIHIS